MTPSKKPKSLQDILKQRQQSSFVGREAQIALFRQNVERSPELRDYFIFNVWGQGGVGKSTLLRQYRKLAEELGGVTAYTNEEESSVPDAIGRLAAQLTQQGQKLETFTERYTVYRQKKQELETDPEAPQGFSAFLGKSLAKAGLGLAKQIPGSGAVTPFLDEEAIAWALAGRGKTYSSLGLYEEALKNYDQAVQLIESLEGHEWMLEERGVLFRKLGRYEEAFNDFCQIIEFNSKRWSAFYGRGELYLTLKRYNLALSDFNHAINLKPRRSWCYYDRALAYLALNQPENAKADLDRAIQLAQQRYDDDSQNHRNTFNLALYHLVARNKAQAEHFYRDALNRGAAKEQIREAIQDLEDLLTVFPEQPWAQTVKAALEKRLPSGGS